jgi:hypothetical protein
MVLRYILSILESYIKSSHSEQNMLPVLTSAPTDKTNQRRGPVGGWGNTGGVNMPQLKTYRINVFPPSNGLLHGHSTSTLQMNTANIQTASKETVHTYRTKDKITKRVILYSVVFDEMRRTHLSPFGSMR